VNQDLAAKFVANLLVGGCRALMKILHKCLSLPLALLCCEIASGQGFVNLGFENTKLTAFLVNEYSGYYATNGTVPGWDWSPHQTFGFGDPNTTVAFNNIALDAPYVTLQGANGFIPAIRGNYSILLQGGSFYVSSNAYAAIWQTGQIPSSAVSLIYWGGALQVSFNGQNLPLYDMGDTPNYTIWGADISAYAGQTGQLMFTAPWQTTAMLDNIQFSSSPIPEPTALSLFICGAFLIWFLVMPRNMKIARKSPPSFRPAPFL
jgi:hypothetical protein